MLSRGVWLLHDNAPAHTANVAQAAPHATGFEQLPHPAYSPDLATSVYYLFRHLKAHLRGRRFADDNEVCHATQAFFESKCSTWFSTGMQMLEHRYEKCVDSRGDYIEKS